MSLELIQCNRAPWVLPSTKRKTGPRLPSRFKKELDFTNHASKNSDEEIDSDVEANDFYDYEEGVPEEESKKNKRFNPIENFEYELPDDFKRGLDAQDEGTRAATSEQLHQYALLTRKMHFMKDSSSSSDDSSDEDDGEEASPGSNQDGPAKLLARAKEKTLIVLEGEDEMPNSGVLSLPFMLQ